MLPDSFAFTPPARDDMYPARSRRLIVPMIMFALDQRMRAHMDAYRTARRYATPIFHCGGAFVACHTVRYLADMLYSAHCATGFFRSMITTSSGPCMALRHFSYALTDANFATAMLVGATAASYAISQAGSGLGALAKEARGGMVRRSEA